MVWLWHNFAIISTTAVRAIVCPQNQKHHHHENLGDHVVRVEVEDVVEEVTKLLLLKPRQELFTTNFFHLLQKFGQLNAQLAYF